jgi:hypothetical protein
MAGEGSTIVARKKHLRERRQRRRSSGLATAPHVRALAEGTLAGSRALCQTTARAREDSAAEMRGMQSRVGRAQHCRAEERF